MSLCQSARFGIQRLLLFSSVCEQDYDLNTSASFVTFPFGFECLPFCYGVSLSPLFACLQTNVTRKYYKNPS